MLTLRSSHPPDGSQARQACAHLALLPAVRRPPRHAWMSTSAGSTFHGLHYCRVSAPRRPLLPGRRTTASNTAGSALHHRDRAGGLYAVGMEIRAARRGFVLGGVAFAAAACTPDNAQPPHDSPGIPVSPGSPDTIASSGKAPTSADWQRLARS